MSKSKIPDSRYLFSKAPGVLERSKPEPAKKRKPLKMFVWIGPLADHSPGMIAVHAASLRTAIDIALRNVYPAWHTNGSCAGMCPNCRWTGEKRNELYKELMKREPEIIAKTGCAYVHGGG